MPNQLDQIPFAPPENVEFAISPSREKRSAFRQHCRSTDGRMYDVSNTKVVARGNRRNIGLANAAFGWQEVDGIPARAESTYPATLGIVPLSNSRNEGTQI